MQRAARLPPLSEIHVSRGSTVIATTVQGMADRRRDCVQWRERGRPDTRFVFKSWSGTRDLNRGPHGPEPA